MRTNSRRRREFDEDEEGFEVEVPSRRPGGAPIDDADPLWTIYAVNPGLPTRTKVEKLMVMWELDAEEISSVLHITLTEAKDMMASVEQQWMDLGRDLTDDELIKARGKQIKELLGLKAELDGLGPTTDQQIIKMKVTLSQQIAKLRGLERERAKTTEDEQKDPVDDALAHLSPDETREIFERLNRE